MKSRYFMNKLEECALKFKFATKSCQFSQKNQGVLKVKQDIYERIEINPKICVYKSFLPFPFFKNKIKTNSSSSLLFIRFNSGLKYPIELHLSLNRSSEAVDNGGNEHTHLCIFLANFSRHKNPTQRRIMPTIYPISG